MRCVTGHRSRCYVSRNTDTKYCRYPRERSILKHFARPSISLIKILWTSELTQWILRERVIAAGRFSTLGVYQPSIRRHSQLRKEMESVASKPLPKRPFRISIAEQINSTLAKPLCDIKRVVLLDALSISKPILKLYGSQRAQG